MNHEKVTKLFKDMKALAKGRKQCQSYVKDQKIYERKSEQSKSYEKTPNSNLLIPPPHLTATWHGWISQACCLE